MFTAVNEVNKATHQDKIHLLKKRYFEETGLELGDPHLDKGGLYFIAEDDVYGVIGGALLVPIKRVDKLNHYLDSQGYQFSNCYVITDVFFHLPSTSPLHEKEEEFDHLVTEFYKNLHKKINAISKKNDLSAVLTFTPLDEHEDIKHFGNWPFIAQHKIDSCYKNEAILGVLSNSRLSLH